MDCENDVWAYDQMRRWEACKNINFQLFNIQGFRQLFQNFSENYIKQKIKERIFDAKQVVLLIGEKTHRLSKFIDWELNLVLEMDLPIIAVNLNDIQYLGKNLCPLVLKNKNVLFVSFQAMIIMYALENFPHFYSNILDKTNKTDYYYGNDVYQELGIVD